MVNLLEIETYCRAKQTDKRSFTSILLSYKHSYPLTFLILKYLFRQIKELKHVKAVPRFCPGLPRVSTHKINDDNKHYRHAQGQREMRALHRE